MFIFKSKNSIMRKEIILEKFQGPLDLLLQLIENEKLAITEISLAGVTEQFFNYLSSLEGERSEELADFLVIATRLVYIKSRQLLPYLYPSEEEAGGSLADQLKFYKRYADASKYIAKRWQESGMAYGRVEPVRVFDGFVSPLNASADELRASMLILLRRLKPINPLPEVRMDRTVSVEQKIKSIYDALLKLKSLSFNKLLADASSRSEIIVSFLALLELIKKEKVVIDQSEAFNDITLSVIKKDAQRPINIRKI